VRLPVERPMNISFLDNLLVLFYRSIFGIFSVARDWRLATWDSGRLCPLVGAKEILCDWSLFLTLLFALFVRQYAKGPPQDAAEEPVMSFSPFHRE